MKRIAPNIVKHLQSRFRVVSQSMHKTSSIKKEYVVYSDLFQYGSSIVNWLYCIEEHFNSARLARMQDHQFQFIIYLTSNDYVQIVCRQESRSQQLQWDPRLKKKMYTRRGFTQQN